MLFCLWGDFALAAETSDPFGTEAMQPRKPALRMPDAAANPCAEGMPNRALNLVDVVNLTLCNNPQTREVWASARVQAAQVGVSKASYLPSASLSVAGNRNSPGANQSSLGLTISYLLYDFGNRAANLENARQLLAAASATQDSTVQAVFLSAVQAFYQAQATQASLDAASESERAAKESFVAADTRYQIGSATPSDKLQAQTAYSQATLNRITAEGNLRNAQGALANTLGLDADKNVSLVTASGYAATQAKTSTSPSNAPASAPEQANVPPAAGEKIKEFEQSITALIQDARRRRPDLQAAIAQVKAADASTAAARAAGKPTISLGASANQINGGGINSHASSLGINVSVPIFSGYAPTYRIRAAEAQAEVKQAQMDRVNLQVALDVWTAYQNLLTATQSLRTTGDLLNSAGQAELVAIGRYKSGVGTILDVLNAQSALASARQQRVQSIFNWNIGRATLAQAMGSLDADLLQTLPDSGISNPQGNHQP